MSNGDRGVVVGPPTNKDADDAELRVHVRFPGNPDTNMNAITQLHLSGGLRIGDEVFSGIDFKGANGKIMRGPSKTMFIVSSIV